MCHAFEPCRQFLQSHTALSGHPRVRHVTCFSITFTTWRTISCRHAVLHASERRRIKDMPASTIDAATPDDAHIHVNGIQHDHTHEQLDEKADEQRGQGGQPEKQKGQRCKSGQAQPQLESAALAFEHGKLGFGKGPGWPECLIALCHCLPCHVTHGLSYHCLDLQHLAGRAS